MTFQPGNQAALNQVRPKPFRDALWQEVKASGDDHRALRQIAAALIKQAVRGNVVAAKEVADRLDGKVPQAIVSDDDGTPMVLQVVRYVVAPVTSELPIADDDQAKVLELKADPDQ